MAGAARSLPLYLSLTALALFVVVYVRQEGYLSARLMHEDRGGRSSPEATHLRASSVLRPRAASEWERLWHEVHASVSKEDFLRRMESNGFLAASRERPPQEPSSPSAAVRLQPVREPKQPVEIAELVPPKNEGRTAAPPPLTRELAASVAQENVIIVTWANDHFADFVFNWVHHIRLHGITNYLVGAMDHDIGAKLTAAGIQSFAMYNEGEHTIDGLHTGAFVWGGEHFHKMGRQKISLAKTFTDFGLDLMLCDVDVVWIKDPTHYFSSIPQADVLTSSDQLKSTIEAGDEGLEMPDAGHSAMNIGLMFFRHSEHTKALIDAWNDALEEDPKLWDQEAFNRLVRKDWMPFSVHPDNPRLFHGAGKTLWVGILPVATFASGHTFFVQDLWEVQGVDPYVVHTTFQYGGPAGKLHRLRERGLWKDPPEYFQGRFVGGNLTRIEAPEGWEGMDTDAKIAFHRASMVAQLRELRQLFVLAVAANRTLIVPRILCFCDRFWGPVEDCKIPGAPATRLPFTCPMDHILEPFHMDDDSNIFGTLIRFREYSFLERLPRGVNVKKTQLTFEVSNGGAEQGLPEPSSLRLPLSFKQTEAAKTLRGGPAEAAAADVVWASDLSGVQGQLTPGRSKSEFEKRMSHVPGIWCCQRHENGKHDGYSYAPFFVSPI